MASSERDIERRKEEITAEIARLDARLASFNSEAIYSDEKIEEVQIMQSRRAACLHLLGFIEREHQERRMVERDRYDRFRNAESELARVRGERRDKQRELDWVKGKEGKLRGRLEGVPVGDWFFREQIEKQLLPETAERERVEAEIVEIESRIKECEERVRKLSRWGI